ncbi:hypothetical protein BDV96DRAFT_647057 [Lophiotrema nucula]|uniref:Uncharacterized protein n=1 Tax=Lophiotrema nucula TaxID=690887 RepID=A0A6A5Z4C8_9PLEO|nr:hypothetical protein BDV96DRAFT_647057 [Lophiotrema nucula]
MSFGYSVGDFFLVVKLAFNVYERCRDSTSEFRDLGRDVGNAHLVLRNIHRFWQAEEARQCPLLVPQQDELRELAGHCEEALEEIAKIQEKHGDLQTSDSFVARVKSRSKYVLRDLIHDFGSVREKLQRYTGNLALFHTMLTSQAINEATTDQKETLEYLKQQAHIMYGFVTTYQEFQDGKRAELAYSQISRAMKPEDRTLEAIRGAEKELGDQGIDRIALQKHRDLIKEWLETVILPFGEDEEDEDLSDDGGNIVPTKQNLAVASKARRITDLRIPDDVRNSVGLHSQTTLVAQDTLRSRDRIDPTMWATDNDPEPSKLSKRRASSVSTHRSKKDDWKDETITDTKKHATFMIAKVLRPKYSLSAGPDVYILPLKRAFNEVDLTGRQWLPRSAVEELLLRVVNHIKCPVSSDSIARLIKNEDEKTGTSDHRINVEEFVNIALKVRELVSSVDENQSRTQGLLLADQMLLYSQPTEISALWTPCEKVAQFSSGYGRPPHKWTFLGKDYDTMMYSNPFEQVASADSILTARNLTNAIYLATIYCTNRMEAALYEWKEDLRQLSKVDREEINQIFDCVYAVATMFHIFESHEGSSRFHWLDKLLETAAFTPLSEYHETTQWNLDFALQLSQRLWHVLLPLLAIVSDTVSCNETDHHGILRETRQRQLLKRTQQLQALAVTVLDDKSASKFKALFQMHQELQQVEEQRAQCLNTTRSLREHQEKEHEARYHAKFDLYVDLEIGPLPRVKFRSPSGFCAADVDGQRARALSWGGETKPRSFFTMSVTRNSSVELGVWRETGGKDELYGTASFKVDEVVDFARKTRVSWKSFLVSGTKTTPIQIRCDIEPKFESTPVARKAPTYYEFESDRAKAYRETLELPLAQYILSQPLPEGWEIRRYASEIHRGKGVYFHHVKASESTAVLWYDPLAELVPDAAPSSLPHGWKRIAKNDKILYQDGSGTLKEDAPSADKTSTFEAVLRLIKYEDPNLLGADLGKDLT